MNDPPDGDVLSLNADSLTLTAECNHVLYKPCIVININKPHLETMYRLYIENDQCKFIFVYFINVKLIIENVANAYKIREF